MEEQMQRQRFERKYFVSERLSLQIRDFVRCYLVPDEFSTNKPDFSYPVHSLYLDSEDLVTYWATVHCEKKRFKLRIRYYDDNPNNPIFFEIKRRENECVLKQRGAVRRSAGAQLLAGHLPGPEHMASGKPHYFVAVQRFLHLAHKLGAKPKVHIAYMREAWMHPRNNSVRVTIDRQVRGEVRLHPVFQTKMQRPVFPFGNQNVLELKFTDRFPDWFADMCRHFDLVQTGAPKYCGSIALGGEHDWMKPNLTNIAAYC